MMESSVGDIPLVVPYFSPLLHEELVSDPNKGSVFAMR
jgi:hypothetical protein